MVETWAFFPRDPIGWVRSKMASSASSSRQRAHPEWTTLIGRQPATPDLESLCPVHIRARGLRKPLRECCCTGIEAQPVDELNSSQVSIGCRVQAHLVLKPDRDRPIPQPREHSQDPLEAYLSMAFLSVCDKHAKKSEMWPRVVIGMRRRPGRAAAARCPSTRLARKYDGRSVVSLQGSVPGGRAYPVPGSLARLKEEAAEVYCDMADI